MPISNKIIMILLLIALVVTIVGTIITVNKLKAIENNKDLLTMAAAGNQNATGTSTLTVQSWAAISNQFPTIQFGSGFVNNTNYCAVCQMGSNITMYNETCCGTFNQTNNRGFLLENTGNINISVNYTCSGSCTATNFVGNSTEFGWPIFSLMATPNSVRVQSGDSTGSVDTGLSCYNSFYITAPFGINRTYANVTFGGTFICGTAATYPLDYADAQDAFVIDLNVTVPKNTIAGGAKTATFTFNAFATG